MILISILATTTLFACVQSTPVSYPTFRRREFQTIERPDLLLLLSQLHALENEPFDSSSGRSASMTRAKRMGNSLSISLPLDTLRERVIQELVRRQQQQNQMQIQQNREFLRDIGKRSSTDRIADSESEKANDFSNHAYRAATTMLEGPRVLGQRKAQSAEDRGTESSQDWFDGDDSVAREVQDDQTRRMANELHLL